MTGVGRGCDIRRRLDEGLTRKSPGFEGIGFQQGIDTSPRLSQNWLCRQRSGFGMQVHEWRLGYVPENPGDEGLKAVLHLNNEASIIILMAHRRTMQPTLCSWWGFETVYIYVGR